jgi:hypothetical protein
MRPPSPQREAAEALDTNRRRAGALTRKFGRLVQLAPHYSKRTAGPHVADCILPGEIRSGKGCSVASSESYEQRCCILNIP